MHSFVRNAIIGICLLFGGVSVASAQETKASKEEVKEALELIQGANDDFDNGAFENALQGYQRAYKIYPSAILLHRMAVSSEKLGDNRSAAKYYLQYTKDDPDGSKVEEARAAYLRLSAGLPPLVTVTSNPAGADVFVDDPNSEPVSTTPEPFELAAGTYRIFVKKDGYRVFETEKQVAPGEEVFIDAELEELKGGSLDDTPLLTSSGGGESDGGPDLRTWGWLGMGLGVALAGTGAVFTVMSNAKTDDVNNYNKRGRGASREDLEDLKSSANRFHNTSIGFYIAGGVLAATGLTLVLLDSGSDSGSAWKLELQPSHEGGAVTFSSSF